MFHRMTKFHGALLLLITAPGFAANGIFAVKSNSISWSSLDTIDFRVLMKNEISDSKGIAVDPAGWLYWADPGFASIRRSNLSGTVVQDVITGLTGVTAVAVDPNAGKVYWGKENGFILRANMDGSDVEALVSFSGYPVQAIVLDIPLGKMFWITTESNNQGYVRSANLDGSGAQTIFTASQSQPYGIDLDRSAGRVYWTDYLSKNVHVADYNGGNHSIFYQVHELWPYKPKAISVDPVNSHLYWLQEDHSHRTELMRGLLNQPTRVKLKDYYGFANGGATTDLSGFEAMVLNPTDHTLYFSGYGYNYVNGPTGWLGRIRLQSPFSADPVVRPPFIDIVHLTLDPREEGTFYWGELGRRRVYRSNLDGSDRQAVVLSAHEPSWLSMDLQNDRFFWADTSKCYDSGSWNVGIFSANLDGSEAEEPVNISCMGDIAVDSTLGFLYWIRRDSVTSSTINRALIGGPNWNAIISHSDNLYIQEIEVDSSAGKIYWTVQDLDTGLSTLRRASSNGTQSEILISPGVDEYFGSLSVDPQDGKIYWVQINLDGYTIRRANVDGTGLEDLTAPSAINPGRIVVDLRQPQCTRTNPFADIANLPGVDFGDVSAVVDAFRNQPTVDPLLCDLYPCDLGGRRCMGDGIIDFRDISQSVDAFRNVYLNCPE